MAQCNLQNKDVNITASEQSFWQTDCSDDMRVHDSLHGDDTNVEDANSAVCGDLLGGDDQSGSDAPSMASDLASVVVDSAKDASGKDSCSEENRSDRKCKQLM